MKKIIPIALSLALLGCAEKTDIDYIESAKQLLAQQDEQAASIAIKNAIKQNPNNSEARFLLGKIHLNNKNYDGAEKELRKALELNYSVDEVLPFLSKAYIKTGGDNALIKLKLNKKKFKEINAKLEYEYNKIIAFIRLNKLDRAKALIRNAKSYQTDSPYKNLVLAQGYLLEGLHDAALSEFNNILEKHPKHAETLLMKARLLTSSNIDEAIETYTVYILSNPKDVDTKFIFASLLTNYGKTEQAEPLVDELLKLNSKQWYLNQMKAIALFNKKNYQQALQYAEVASQSNPDEDSIRLLAGTTAFYLKDYEKAFNNLSLIASRLKEDHPAINLLVASQLELGLTLDAYDTLSTDNLSSLDQGLIMTTGITLAKKGEISKAKQLLSNKVDNDKLSTEALTQRGLLKLSLNDVSGIIDVKSALESQNLAPQQTSHLEKVLIASYIHSQQFDKALDIAKKWQDSDDKKLMGYNIQGIINARSKDFSAAISSFESILAIDPNNVEAKFNLLKLGLITEDANKGDVTNDLKQLVTENPKFIPAIEFLYALLPEQSDRQGLITQTQQTYSNDNSNSQLAITLAKMLYTNEGYKKVIEILANETANTKGYSLHWQLLSSSYIKTLDFDNAEATLQAWLSELPNDNSAVLTNLAILDAKNAVNEALNLVNSYIERKGDSLQFQLWKTHLLLRKRMYTEARAIYDALPESLYDNPITKGFLGQFQLASGELQPAIENLKLGFTAIPSQYMMLTLVNALVRNGEHQEAKQILTNRLKAAPSDQVTLMTIASLDIEKNEESAIASYEKIISINDKNLVALNNIAYLLAKNGDKVKAKVYAEKAVNVAPENPDALDTLGRILLDLGETELALDHLSKAVVIAKNEAADELKVNYIEALLVNKQEALAKRKINEFSITESSSKARLLALKNKYSI